MSMPETRRKSEWTAHYNEPEIKVPDEFRELDIIEIDDGSDDHPQAVMYGPEDTASMCEWFQIDAEHVVTPER